jgi:NAD(P)-dependent dehydrogenase (short-subunit alcohol dehydrogenase family)
MHTDSAKPTLVVTGTSSGIGRAIAARAVKTGWRVFGSVRSERDRADLTREMGQNFTPILLDVRDQQTIEEAAREVTDALGSGTLAGLVNNAGIGLAGPLLHQPMEEFEAVLDTNLTGTLRVTRAFAPLLGADRNRHGATGRIVNISSIAGKVGQPFGGAYVASKHALEGLSDVMRRELALYGIKVIIVAPATVDTPIWEEPESAIERYAQTDYGQAFADGVKAITKAARSHGMTADKVGEIVLAALTARHPRLRYAPAQHPVLEQILPRLTPQRLTDFIAERALGLIGGARRSSDR